ncbi:Cytochrome P450 monooygenase 3 [Fusarium oxysporum]|nr:Cytochrome P450 monooygenase 3 [Fusarium oxysporum]
MNAFITLIEHLELAGSRALRIVVASAVLWGATGLLALAWWTCKQLFDEGALPYPVVGDTHAQSFEENLILGMQKYRDSPFVLAGSRPPLLILPMAVFHKCHNMPNDRISIIAEHEDKFQGKYTHITTIRPEIPATIRQDVTRNMSNIILDFQDELAYASEQWSRTSNWTSVPLYKMMLRTVALLSGRAFVGLPLCRDQAWLQASIGYTVDCISIRDQLHTWSPILRPLIGPFLPSVRSVRRHLRFAATIMAPLISQALQEDGKQRQKGALPTDQTESRGTFISWLLRHLPEELRTPEQVGLDQMLVSFAAIHTTTMALTKVIWELAKRPEYIEPLRAEMHDVFGPEVSTRAICINKDALSRLQKLDSFIREVQRWCPSTFVTPSRRVMKSMTLSNGIKLPRGTSIAFPAHAIHMSEDTPTFSPNLSTDFTNPSPRIFDGFRYSNLRSIKGQESHHQAATTGPDYLIFNHGKHACPGRFFAICEIKMILIELLAKYDFRLEDGKPGPELIRVGTETRLDTEACFEIRSK